MSALDLLSDWSSFTHISISDKQWQEGNTGRYYYRHPTEPGTVIGWHDIGTNADVELLVFDAVKRGLMLDWDVSLASADSSLPNISSTNINGTLYIDGSSAGVEQAAASRLTEAQLNTLWTASAIDPNTAKYNCDVWSGTSVITDYPVVQFARNVTTTDGHQADIPNMQQLMRIFCMASVIDALDPTAAANAPRALVGWLQGHWAWSSSERNTAHMRTVDSAGCCTSAIKANTGAAIPVLELYLL